MSDILGPRSESPKNGWLAVVAIAAGTFLLVSTEFLPVGLLGSIAKSLQVTNGSAGLVVTLPGAVAAIAAPLSTIGLSRVDRRIVLCTLTGLVILSNLIVAFSPTFETMLLGRVLLGIGVGGLWSFAIAAARRLVPDNFGARATAVVSAGIGIGTVFGLPAGSAIGALLGWRGAFSSVAGFGVIVLIAQVGKSLCMCVDNVFRFRCL